jgi:hypothetical protein
MLLGCAQTRPTSISWSWIPSRSAIKERASNLARFVRPRDDQDDGDVQAASQDVLVSVSLEETEDVACDQAAVVRVGEARPEKQYRRSTGFAALMRDRFVTNEMHDDPFLTQFERIQRGKIDPAGESIESSSREIPTSTNLADTAAEGEAAGDDSQQRRNGAGTFVADIDSQMDRLRTAMEKDARHAKSFGRAEPKRPVNTVPRLDEVDDATLADTHSDEQDAFVEEPMFRHPREFVKPAADVVESSKQPNALLAGQNTQERSIPAPSKHPQPTETASDVEQTENLVAKETSSAAFRFLQAHSDAFEAQNAVEADEYGGMIVDTAIVPSRFSNNPATPLPNVTPVHRRDEIEFTRPAESASSHQPARDESAHDTASSTSQATIEASDPSILAEANLTEGASARADMPPQVEFVHRVTANNGARITFAAFDEPNVGQLSQAGELLLAPPALRSEAEVGAALEGDTVSTATEDAPKGTVVELVGPADAGDSASEDQSAVGAADDVSASAGVGTSVRLVTGIGIGLLALVLIGLTARRRLTIRL